MKLYPTASKESRLREWMKECRVFRTHEVIQWGLDHFYNRANRTKGQLHRDGVIRELTPEEKLLRGVTTKEGLYEYVADLRLDNAHATP